MTTLRQLWNAHHNKILNLLGLAAPVVAGVVSGGVFTLPVLVTAGGVIAAKYAQTPMPPPVPVVIQQTLEAAAKRGQ